MASGTDSIGGRAPFTQKDLLWVLEGKLDGWETAARVAIRPHRTTRQRGLRAVAERNYCIKYTYFFPKLYANFAAVMYVYNRAATLTVPAAVLNRVAYVVTMPPQLNITKVIELS